MKTILSSRRHHYVAGVSIFLITVALVVGMVGCGGGGVEYDLTIASIAGGWVFVPGEGTSTYDEGTVVNLVAEAEEGYRFINWTGNVGTIANVNDATTIITMNGDHSITANFVAVYDLTISSTAGGSVTTPGEGTFIYDELTVVNLVAEAEEGYSFVNWTGDVDTIADVNDATTTITMLDHYFIAANFAQPQFKTYSKYGFSFEYPRTASVTETGNLESEANDTSGVVEVVVENGKSERFSVVWMTMTLDEIESWPGGLEGILEYELEGIVADLESSEEVASVEKGELVEATKAGHPIFYQDYTVNFTEGYKIYGVSSCFYCDNSLKLFFLNIVSSEEDSLGDFQNYLDSFVCH